MKITLFAASALTLFAICANVSGQSQAACSASCQETRSGNLLPRSRIRKRESEGSLRIVDVATIPRNRSCMLRTSRKRERRVNS